MLLAAVIVGIVVMAWAALWWLEQSPYGWLFHQHGSSHQHAVPAVPAGLQATFFLAGWVLMTIAMMLPTTVPLSRVFHRMVSRRDRSGWLMALLFTGYLAAWLAFGVMALALLWGIQGAIDAVDQLSGNKWLFSAALFLLAGAFQFSALKYACLDKCRTPTGFVISHWHGRNAPRESFNLGWQHGVFCVGCCWALMLLMFAVSTASLAWMLVLAVLMAIEKNLPWGRRLARPLGAVLLTIGVALATSQWW